MSDNRFWLERIDGALALCQDVDNKLKPFSLDFCRDKYAYRLKQTKNMRLPLGVACGLTKGRRPAIVDATAGLAVDGLLLAALGAKVTLVEQHPLIHGLIEDAIERARSGPSWIQAVMTNIQLVHANAIHWLKDNSSEVIYLDPMYPEPPGSKKAQVKKGMQLLRLLPDTGTDTKALFAAAREAATERLVVKRPDWAETLSGEKPDNRMDTKTHHYDIYLT